MIAERQATVEAILRAGHIPAGMELFAAGDKSQWETIRQWIDDSDLFLLILGGRYGSIEPTSGRSYIDREYEYAVKAKKPHFAAVISEAYLQAKLTELGENATEMDNRAAFAKFRSKIMAKMCRLYSDINELKLIVFESLSDFSRRDDLSGWVRGSEAVNPAVALGEISRLQEENSALRSELDLLKLQFAEPLDIDVVESEEDQVLNAMRILDDDAKSLLAEIKFTGKGLARFKHNQGRECTIVTGECNYVSSPTHRSYAKWKAVFENLVALNLIESMGYNIDPLSPFIDFSITHIGYLVADAFEAEKFGHPKDESKS
jgi:hypothetical protein